MSRSPNPGSRHHVIRQDRFEIPDLRCVLRVGESSFPILNFSSFGLAILVEPRDYSISELAQIEGDVTIEEHDFGRYLFRVVRLEKGDHAGRLALETLGNPLQVELMNLFPRVFQDLTGIKRDKAYHCNLPDEFRFEVLKLKESFESYRQAIKNLADQQRFLSFSEKDRFEQFVVEVFGKELNQDVKETNWALQKIADGFDKALLKQGLEYFRFHLKDYIFSSPFAERSFSKPLGYAGDFEMMNLIYRNESLGIDLFSRCMEHAMQLHPEPQAVRNRASFLEEKIRSIVETLKRPQIRILSVACGPAFEVQKFIANTPNSTLEKIHFHLLDQDELALKSSQHSILQTAKSQGKQVKLTLLKKSIRNVITSGLEEDEFDLIYSAGLFDYFTDPVAQRAAEKLRAGLSESGQLIIGNFDIGTPNSFGMKSLFDWSLILRSKEDLIRLFGDQNYQTVVESEKNGINLFCTIRRT